MSGQSRQFLDAQDAFARCDFAAAFETAGQIVAVDPTHAHARALRANAALKLDRWTNAIADLDWLLARQPDHPTIRKNLSVCWMRLGNGHKERGESTQAESAYRRALAAHPQNADAHFNFGMLLLEIHRSPEAVDHLRRAVEGDPANSTFALKLAEAQLAVGANDAALHLLEGIAARGGTREQMQQCSRLLLDAAAPDAAIAIARRLIDGNPESRAWVREFCRQLRKDSNLRASRELLGELRVRADSDEERLRIDIASALGLPSTYPDRAALTAIRADFLRHLDRLVEDYPPRRIARIAPTPEALLWDNFLLAYQGENDVEPQRRFGRWLSASLATLLPPFTAASVPAARARPRIAMVSSRFHQCTVGSYFASWVEHLGQAGWDLLLVHVGNVRDALSAHLARVAQREVALSANFAEAARTLSELDADIILYPDLGMDYRMIGLAALRLAPVQACGWGHPVTTGLPTIDAFISCAEMEPVDAPSHYTEHLLTLPGIGTRYLSPPISEPAARAVIGLPESGTLYLVPQSLFKLHPDNDRVFADIARRDPAAMFVFFEGPESGARDVFDARLARAFREAGIDTGHRFLFLHPRARADYLQVNMACDVMLDTLHFSGGNTSLDALHAGLPIVTSPGRYMRGRQSTAMLRHLGLHESIAENPGQLAELAVQVANDRARRTKLSERIHAGLPELTQSTAPLHALDAHLKSLLASR